MNDKKRKKLRTAEEYIDKASEIITDVLYEENSCLNSMPENLESSEMYIRIEDAVDNLEDAVSSLREASDSLNNAAM